MEAVKGNWENRKNEAEFALRRLVAVRNKEPQPSLHVLQRKVEEMKKELEKFGNAQGALLEKGSGRLTDEERTNYVTNYEQKPRKSTSIYRLIMKLLHYLYDFYPEIRYLANRRNHMVFRKIIGDNCQPKIPIMLGCS